MEYHSEANAIMWSRPEDRTGATLYVTFEPCGDCSKLIRGVGIAHVVWLFDGTNIIRWDL
ncbi:hypothetical protein ACR6C2_16595 [Streptomyces sp. INA 01156]